MNKNTFNFQSVVVIFFIILTTVALVKTYVLRQIEETAKQEIKNTLLTVLNTSHESFLIWTQAHKGDLVTVAASHHLLQLTKELLKAPRSRPALLNNPLQSEMRNHLLPEMNRHALSGFFIIAPDFISLSSMRDANIGTTNLMTEQKDFLSRVFKGETLISYPMKSDVPLPDHHGKLQNNLPTMFVATPIFDERKNIIAVMTFRFDPKGHFTEMLQLARLGKTGETYAFDVSGMLISESRFDKEIRQAGLIKKGEEALLNVQIRDPGVNLLEGERINVPIDERPLTLMASEAIRGKSGSNIDGYRDYRGVTVVGAWLWEKTYGIGLTTEMDKAEAYANLDQTKELVLISFIITFLSFALFATYVIFLGKRSEKDQLKRMKSEERLQKMFESTSSVIYEKDVEGKYTYVNKQFEKIWEIPREHIYGKTDYELFSKKTADSFMENNKKVLESKKLIQFEETVDFEGGPQTYIGAKFPLFDEEGNVHALCGISTDITGRKIAEEQLRQSEVIVDNSSDMMALLDKDYIYLAANPAYFGKVGKIKKQLIGNTVIEVFGVEFFNTIIKPHADICLGGKEVHYQDWFDFPDSIRAYMDISYYPYFVEKEVKGFVVTGRDITEKREAEIKMEKTQKQLIAAQKLAGVGELAAGVSHEVLNPVNIISVHTQMLQRKTKDDSNIQNFCNKVKHEIDRIQKIMGSLLAFSRNGQVELVKGHMRNTIEETLALVENEYKLDNIKIVRDWCDSLVDISYDPDKIRQVYLNLINNAKHAMPDGGIITVGCRAVNKTDKNFHQFTFSDTGTGMSEEIRLKVFEPFFTTKPEGEGTGMGLAVIHGIIEEHDGKIRVESEEGKGTTFIISLPIEALM